MKVGDNVKTSLDSNARICARICICSASDVELYFLRCLERSNCFSAPCLNAGTCIEQPGGYKCNCKYHYSGINCQG